MLDDNFTNKSNPEKGSNKPRSVTERFLDRLETKQGFIEMAGIFDNIVVASAEKGGDDLDKEFSPQQKLNRAMSRYCYGLAEFTHNSKSEEGGLVNKQGERNFDLGPAMRELTEVLLEFPDGQKPAIPLRDGEAGKAIFQEVEAEDILLIMKGAWLTMMKDLHGDQLDSKTEKELGKYITAVTLDNVLMAAISLSNYSSKTKFEQDAGLLPREVRDRKLVNAQKILANNMWQNYGFVPTPKNIGTSSDSPKVIASKLQTTSSVMPSKALHHLEAAIVGKSLDFVDSLYSFHRDVLGFPASSAVAMRKVVGK